MSVQPTAAGERDCTERGEIEMAQLVSKALQNKLRSNLAPPKGILSQDKILGEEPSGVAALASVCRYELSAILPQISNFFCRARML